MLNNCNRDIIYVSYFTTSYTVGLNSLGASDADLTYHALAGINFKRGVKGQGFNARQEIGENTEAIRIEDSH